MTMATAVAMSTKSLWGRNRRSREDECRCGNECNGEAHCGCKTFRPGKRVEVETEVDEERVCLKSYLVKIDVVKRKNVASTKLVS